MTPDWSQAVVLSTTEFEVCWELLGLGETPWQLDPPRSGGSTQGRRRVVDGVVGDLHRRGLGDRSGPAPRVARLLSLLAHPQRSVDVRYRAEILVAGVAACRGPRCAFAVRHRDEIALLELAAADATAAVVGLLGPLWPGAGREVHLPGPILDGALAATPRDATAFAQELMRRGVSRPDAETVAAMCGDADLRGQLGSSVDARDGTRIRRGPYVVGVHRTASGTYRQVRRPTPDGGRVTIAPAGGEDVLGALTELADVTG